VEDSDPAELRKRNRHVCFGDGIHRRGQDRNVERDLAGEEGASVGLAGQDRGFERLQEDVVERQAEGNFRGVAELSHIGP